MINPIPSMLKIMTDKVVSLWTSQTGWWQVGSLLPAQKWTSTKDARPPMECKGTLRQYNCLTQPFTFFQPRPMYDTEAVLPTVQAVPLKGSRDLGHGPVQRMQHQIPQRGTGLRDLLSKRQVLSTLPDATHLMYSFHWTTLGGTSSESQDVKWLTIYICYLWTEMAKILLPGTFSEDIWPYKISPLYLLYFHSYETFNGGI